MMTDVETLAKRDVSAAGARRFGRINLLVVAAQVVAWTAILIALQQDIGVWLRAPLVVLFCLMMQGVFSLMHECFHGHGHPHPGVNMAMGRLASTLFGTSYTLFRINHLGHHVRNRTEAELVDYVLPGESAVQKTVLYYAGILGGIWLLGFLGAVLLPFLPYPWAQSLASQGRNNTYSSAFDDFTRRDWNNMRLEMLLGMTFWIVVVVSLDWNWRVLLIAYAAFAFSWSLLQWVYHVRTPIHVVEGAYNLRLPTVIRWLFLNFNYNLTHHREPAYRWQDLYAVSDQAQTQPLLYRLIRMVLPPQPLPDNPDTISKTYF